MASVNVALLGSGLFAKNAHLPAIAKQDVLKLTAVYSRSKASCDDVIAAAKKLLPYADEIQSFPEEVSKTALDELLARSDISAVIIALPILSQPDVIRKALAAGSMHVVPSYQGSS